ncbi:2-dehydropantoate 2-reductase N-terminal domain-containing protein [Kribbella flavida]|uniref:2-dehydropantoate 2-reductase N-terminal domain-containing protein n=1 Tax=Kribbella flavida TaxID=182640 RepID=UPI0013052FDD|nr:2-dehydropantoate 2-reductase N-terminal domain-containing protein [Kribbella flavida]
MIVIAVKSQDTSSVLRQLARAAPPNVHVVCAQNGVGNEPEALRWFANVYGALVQCPTLHLDRAWWAVPADPFWIEERIP